MTEVNTQLSSYQSTSAGDAEAIMHLEQAVISGRHWYIGLLESIGLWTSAEETCNGCHYRYLIAGEAFDWLLLAERLCQAVDGLLPDDGKIPLLFYGKPPLNLSTKVFKELIGQGKYHQYLNYFYGVTVEEALLLAMREEVRKEWCALGCGNGYGTDDEVYWRVYGATKAVLLKLFRREKACPQVRFISLSELKEFTYWLFKYRLEQCDKSRVASDTRKALEQLNWQWTINGFSRGRVAGY
ncbi:hypothetical protein ACFLVM_01870 [Chloroflexota bacterium]